MKVSSKTKRLLEEIPELILNLAKQAVEFAENMTRASTSLTEEIKKMEVDDKEPF